MTAPVNPDQLRISIEMGDDYQPSDRLSAALGELAATLAEEESDAEVSGFQEWDMDWGGFKALSFDSIGTAGSRGRVFPKVERSLQGKGAFEVFWF
jgi:hypothetical protein